MLRELPALGQTGCLARKSGDDVVRLDVNVQIRERADGRPYAAGSENGTMWRRDFLPKRQPHHGRMTHRCLARQHRAECDVRRMMEHILRRQLKLLRHLLELVENIVACSCPGTRVHEDFVLVASRWTISPILCCSIENSTKELAAGASRRTRKPHLASGFTRFQSVTSLSLLGSRSSPTERESRFRMGV